MGNLKNKIFDVTSVGLTDLVGTGTVSIFWFYIASELGPENYGELTYLISIAALVSGIALFGSNHTIWILGAKKMDIHATIFLITSITSLVGAIAIFILFQDIGISFIILAYFLLSLVLSDFLGKKLYQKYSKYVITQKILMVVFGIGMYYLFGESGILIGIAASYVHLIYPMYTAIKNSKINFNLFKEKKGFIINNLSLSFTRTFQGSMDKLIVAPLLGFTILGNYSLGLQFFSIISILPGVAVKYLIAQDVTGIANKKLKKIMLISSIGIAILGSTIVPTVISYFFPKFIEAEEIIRIISWAVIPLTIQSTYYIPKLWAQEKNRLILYHTLLVLIIQIIGILILGTLYGTIGIAIAFVISNSIGCVFIATVDKITNDKLN
jgi:O-antigen/teichoic acid export membrane protein